ncbi:MAG TPA: hypothetical protein VMT82_11230 [candidate division Zixibacteria bacterium]|nr:hypothetical protein [candidate division Zixibacteria bacterium]
MKLYLRYALVAFALSGLCFAQTANEPAKKAAHATKKKVAANATKEELKALEDKLNAQQKALDALQQQNTQLNQSLQQTQSQLTEAQNAAHDAQSKVSALESEQKPAITKLQSDVADVRNNLTNTAATLQTEQKRITDLEHPLSIAYKGIRITPAGFTEATAYWRQRATQSDQATPFQAIPVGAQYSGGYNSHLSEFGITARDSRVALRIDADAGKTKLAAYVEGDFFGTGPTSNINQTTSYNYRIRQAWGRAKFANGWTITGGQMWTLMTLNRKGVDSDNANLWIPNIIEASYSVGYDWGRYGEIRIGKQINDRVSAAFAFTNPSYVNQTNNTTAGVEGIAAAGNGLWGNSLVNGAPTCTNTVVAPVPPATLPTVTTTCTATVTPTYSTNLVPDMQAKVAYDHPRLGHYEVKGIARIFRDRVAPGTTVNSYGTTFTSHGYNNEALGWGIGGGAVVPIKPKKIDFIAQGMYGKGISRYQASGQYDFVLRNTGAAGDYDLQPVKTFSALAALETHPKPKMELDVIFGDEYYYRTTYNNGANGYGSPNLVNTGCYFENTAAYNLAGFTGSLPACTANNRNLTGSQIVFYYDLYKGPMGTLRYGVTYEYLTRATWSGVGGAPKGNDSIGYTTMRYIFP